MNAPAASGHTENNDILYVADRHLNVVLVNDHWHAFAENNDGRAAFTPGARTNLLDSFSGSERSRWQAIYKSLIEGQMPFYEADFLCPSPHEWRVFKLRIERHHDDSAGLLLVHRIIRQPQDNRQDTKPAQARGRLSVDLGLHAAGFTIASSLEPLLETSGDLIWCRGYKHGQADFVIADAAGHGAAASQLALRVGAILDQVARASHSVSANVTELNAQLCAQMAATRGAEVTRVDFATGLYVRIDRQARTTTICSFGHPGAIFAKTGYVQPAPGLPVGIRTEGGWIEQPYSFEQYGAQLLMFTDGITEQFNPTGRMLGHAQLAQFYVEHAHLHPPQRLEKIQNAVAVFRGDALVKDDQALMLVDTLSVV